MIKMGWIKNALYQGELKITTDMICPYCNQTKRSNGPAALNACKEHRWVNKAWYEGRFE